MSMRPSESRGPTELVSILRKKTVRRNAGVRGQSKNPNQAAKSRPQQQQQQASTTGHISDRHQPDQSSSSSQPKKIQKPRRRVATIAQRRAANIRERRRMFNLNAAFDRLRKKVPSFAYEKRLSRIETLKLAIMYIRFMDDLVHDDAYAEKYKQLIANSSQGSASLGQNSSAFFSTPPNNHTYMPLYAGQHCPPPAPPTPPSESGGKRSSFQGQTLMVDAVQNGNQMDCHNEDCCPQQHQQQRQYRQMISGSSPINGLCCGLASPPSLYSSSSSSVSHSSCHSTSPASSTTFTDSSSLSPVAAAAAASKPISLLFDNYHRQHQTCTPAGPPSQQQQPAQYPHGYEQFQDNISISTYYNCDGPGPTKYYNELNCYEQKLAPMSCYPASKQCQQSGQISDLSQAHSNQLEQQHRGSSPATLSLPLPAALPLRPLSPLETTRSSVGVNGSYSLQSLEAR